MNKWRLPTGDELKKAYKDKVDGFESNYYWFEKDYYWSSSEFEGYSNLGWFVYFFFGYDGWNFKSNDNYVRLVKGSDKLKWCEDIEHMNWYEAQDYVKEMNTKKEN